MQRRRQVAVLIAALVGLPLAVLIVVAAAITAGVMFGVSVDAARWRDTAAERAAAALGRPVILQGKLQLTLGRELVLRSGGVRIMNPPGFGAQPFLEVGEASVKADLFDVLRGRLRLRSIEASGIGLWLERAADGRGNWALPPRDQAQRPSAAIEIDRVVLHGLSLHYHDARAATHRVVVLDEVSANLGRDARRRLALRGRWGDDLPYTLTLDGGLRLARDESQPWPFSLDLHTDGARLHANGTVDARAASAAFGFSAEARADALQSIGRLLGARLPDLGAATLQGTVAATADAVDLNDLRGSFGESELSGQLALALAGARPRLSGTLTAAAIDLQPFFAADAQPGEKPLDDGAPAGPALALRDALPLDIAVDLNVERWVGLPVDLGEARFELRADPRGLRMPMRAALGGVPLTGSLELDTAAPTPKLALQLAANNAALGDLARGLVQADGIEGTLGQLELRVDGRGDTLGALLRDLALSLSVQRLQFSTAHAAGARPIAGTLDTLELAVRRGQRLQARARGTLLGERATLELRAGTLAGMLAERATPLELTLMLAQAQLRIDGFIAHPEARRGSALGFDFQARRSGDLARWLGVAPDSDLSVALRGRLRRADDAWFVDATTLALGRSRMTLNARRSVVDGRPVTRVALSSAFIDAAELATLAAGAEPGERTGTAASARIDAPIFNAALELADADVQLELKRVLLGRTELADLVGTARSRDGRLLPSTLRGTLAGAAFTSTVELDLRGAPPTAGLDLSTAAIDIGLLLRQLGVAEDIDGRVDALQLQLRARGNTLRELAEQSDIEARLSGGSISVLGARQLPVADIRVGEASLGAAAGQPIRLRLDGTLDDSAVRIDVKTATFADFTRDAGRLPFALQAQAAGTRLRLDGEVALPLGRQAQLALQMGGERLDTLNALTRTELPPWGPWSVRGPIRITPDGYALPALQLAVGSSRLGGSGSLDLSGARPRLDVQMTAQRIQLDDFEMPERLTDPPPQPRSGAAQGQGLRGTATELAGRTDRLLGAKFLRRFDARIDVKAKEVLSGTDRLADGALRLLLDGGRLRLDPLLVNLPGGALQLTMAYDFKESELDFAMAAQVERFDYGIIARRLGRASNVKGLFSMDLALAGTAPSLDAIMQNANGKLDLAVWPTDLSSGVFNLWSVNMVLALLPLIDPGGTSRMNCIVGRFDLKNGMLSDERIIIDTTTLRIRGAGSANLASEELAFVFRPRAKGFALFRLQTPLRVTGTFTDQRFGFTPPDVAESVLLLIASPVMLPFQWLTQGPMPRDGADVCTDPLRSGG